MVRDWARQSLELRNLVSLIARAGFLAMDHARQDRQVNREKTLMCYMEDY